MLKSPLTSVRKGHLIGIYYIFLFRCALWIVFKQPFGLSDFSLIERLRPSWTSCQNLTYQPSFLGKYYLLIYWFDLFLVFSIIWVWLFCSDLGMYPKNVAKVSLELNFWKLDFMLNLLLFQHSKVHEVLLQCRPYVYLEQVDFCDRKAELPWTPLSKVDF